MAAFEAKSDALVAEVGQRYVLLYCTRGLVRGARVRAPAARLPLSLQQAAALLACAALASASDDCRPSTYSFPLRTPLPQAEKAVKSASSFLGSMFGGGSDKIEDAAGEHMQLHKGWEGGGYQFCGAHAPGGGRLSCSIAVGCVAGAPQRMRSLLLLAYPPPPCRQVFESWKRLQGGKEVCVVGVGRASRGSTVAKSLPLA